MILNPGDNSVTVTNSQVFEIVPENNDIVQLTYDFAIPNSAEVHAGDTYSVLIPEIIQSGNIIGVPFYDEAGIELGTFSISGQTLTVTFGEEINKMDDKIFDVTLTGMFNKDMFNENNEVPIEIPLLDGTSFEVVFKPKAVEFEGTDKKTAGTQYVLIEGQKVEVDRNPEFVDWTVRVNDSMDSIASATVIDTLGSNLEFISDNFKVERIIRNYKNVEIGREVVTGLTPTQTANGFELNIGSIEDAYDITYTTRLIRPDGGGTLAITNNASIILDGNSNDVNDTVTGTWSGDIPTVTKDGLVSSNRQDVIDWTVHYNFGKENLGLVTLTDLLSHGTVIADTIKIQQVDTDIDGQITNEIEDIVTATSNIDGETMTISDLDAEGKAYVITFSSSVPGGYDGLVNNKITDNLPVPSSDDADVEVNTVPTGGKVGEQKIGEDGRPYIEWTITLNSEKIDVGNINILDVFNGDYLDFDATDTDLYEMYRDGVEASNFTVTPHTHDNGRVGFKLAISDVGPSEYKFVYRTYYTTLGMQQPELANSAEILFENGDGIGIGETIIPGVELEGPQPGIIKSAIYVANESNTTQEIEWTVTFNASKILLDAGSKLVDEFTSGNYNFVTGSETVTPAGDYTFTPGADGNGFVLTLNEATNQTIVVKYRTTTDDAGNLDHTNKATLNWQGGEQEAEQTIGTRVPNLHKAGQVKINTDGTKQVDWVITVNDNRQVIYDFVLVDKNQPASSEIKDIVVNKNGTPLGAADYTLSGPLEGSFTINIAKLDAVPYTITYSSMLTPAQEKELIRNDVNVTFRGGTNKEGYGIPSPDLRIHKKAVNLDKKTGIISWDMIVNDLRTKNGHANSIVNLVNATLTDTIPADQKLVQGSVKVMRKDNNTITAPVTELDNSFTVDLPDGPYEWYVTLETEILRHPSDDTERPDRYRNSVVLANENYNPMTSNAYIDYFATGDLNSLTKVGSLNDDTENVDWRLTLNPLNLKIVNPIIKDTLDPDKIVPDHYYLTDSFVLTDGDNNIIPESAYNLTFSESNSQFEINFTAEEITTAINISYSTRVRADLIGPFTLTNDVELFGGGHEIEMGDNDGDVSGHQWFFGGGGSGRTLEFTINKVDGAEDSVANATFEFIRVTPNGTEVPLDNIVTTDKDGVYHLSGVRAGRYIVTELEAPTAYEVLNEPFYVMLSYASPQEQAAGAGDYIVTVTDSNWNASSNEIASANGNTLTIVNQFKTRDIAATKIWRSGPWSTEERPEAYLQLHRRVASDEEGEAVPGLNPVKVSESARDNNAPDVVTGASVVQIGWQGVEVYSPEGDLYQYFVREVDAEGNNLILENYTRTYGTLENGLPDYLTVINTNNETVTINGTKTWLDYDNAHNTRPQLLVVQLTQYLENEASERIEAKVFREQTIGADEEGNWTYSFTTLPKYDSIGREFKYEISERVPAPYTMTRDGYNLTNTYINSEQVEIHGNKVWTDLNDGFGDRPESIKVGLYRELEGERDTTFIVEPVVISEANDWHYDFREIVLPKYDQLGNEYTYVIEELDVPEDYSSVITGTSLITNTHNNAEKVSVSGLKTWNDWVASGNEEKQSHPRPESITVKLLQDNREIDRKVVSAEDNWHYTFNNLPKKSDKDAHEFVYAIEEVPVSGYTTVHEITGNVHNLVNTYNNIETTKLSGYKIWNDYQNQFGTRPASIKVQLTQDNIDFGEPVTVTADGIGSWIYEFEDLPKYDTNGKEFEYRVRELETEAGDLEVYEGRHIQTTKGWDIENTYVNHSVVSVSTRKVWEDWLDEGKMDNQLTPRPTSVTVSLWQNGSPFIGVDGKPVTRELTAANNWKYSWSDLPQYDEKGVSYVYTIREDGAEEGNLVDYEHSIDGYTVTNTYQNTELIDIVGSKIWDDYANKFETRPESIIVTLRRDNVQINTSIISEQDNWEFIFNNLPKYKEDGTPYVYTIDEVLPAPYTKKVVEVEENEYTITNTYVNAESVRINGQKVWNDNKDKLGRRPANIGLTLYQRVTDNPEDNVALTSLTINAHDSAAEASITINEDDIWAYDFGEYPKYDVEGNEYIYTITEQIASIEYETEITGTSAVRNTYLNDDTVSVVGQKTWDDWSDVDSEYAANQATPRPESISITLLRNSVEVDSISVTAENNWQYSFTNIEKYDDNLNEYVYTIKEEVVAGYETTTDGYNITNTYIDNARLDLSGFKIWDDYNDKFNTRPKEITIHLVQDGSVIEEKTVKANGAGQWTYSFKDLPVYDENGKPYDYTLHEDAVESYNPPVITETEEGFDIKNTFINTETTEAIVTKDWVDWADLPTAGDQLTPRPSSIIVQLLQNGIAIGDKQEITQETWSHTFTNLPKYDELGEAFEYTVEEVAVDNYETTVEGLAITNTYQNTETINIEGTKVWIDYSNKHNIRPAELAIYLLQNGEPYGSPQEIKDNGNEDDEWVFVFENLPRYDENGRAFNYTFNEVATVPYVKAIDETGRVITNTYVNTEKVAVTGQKVWADFENEYGNRPEAITVNLYRNDVDQEISQVVTANPAGQWIYNFEDLAKYDENGVAFTYTVTEDTVEGYTTIVDVKGFIVNTIDPQNTGIAGEKTWVDYDNKFNTRPEAITVHLLQNGERYAEQEVTPNEDGQWLYQFTDIPDRDKDGKKYVYTVEEDEVTEYEITYDGYNITNTYVNTETVDINGEKVWDDYNDKFETRPESILVVLYRNGTEDNFRRVTADAEDNWTFSFTDLPVYDAEGNAYEYSVEEVTVRPYTSEKTSNDEGFVTFTNTYINDATTEFRGQKHWEDFDDKYGLRPESINVILNQNGTVFEDQAVEVDLRGNWRYNFSDLPKYDAQGEAYTYTVEDDIHAYEMDTYYNDLYNALITTDVVGTKTWNDFEDRFDLRPDAITINLNQTIEGSEASVVLHSTEITAENNWSYAFNNIPTFDANGNEYIYSVSEEAVEDKPLGAYTFETEGYDLINTLVTTQVEVAKTWSDFEDEYGLRPEEITFNLLQNGEVFDSITVSVNENWSHIFKDIPKFDVKGEEYLYTVTENKVEAYETAIADYAVTNTLITKDITGSKTWNDLEDKFGLRPDSITVNLVQATVVSEETRVLKTVVVTAEDEWSFVFTDVPVYDAAGNEYIYTLTEEVNAAYTPVIDQDNYSIRNNLKLTEFKGSKVWIDSDNQFGLRPEAITVRLFQTIPGLVEQVEITNQVVTAENDWTFTFSELPFVNSEGVEYIYSITEDEVNAYITEINGAEITNSLITIPVAGQKVWNDYQNKFGVRPETITINLLQNGETLLVLPVTAAEDGSWSFSFDEVPKFDTAGEPYVYTVTEDAVSEYNAPEINGTIITNTYVNSDVIAVSGEKLWDDFENRLESRPESITIVLLQNDVAYLEPQIVTPDQNNKWIYSFTDLLEYDELGEAYEYTIEELVVERYETTYGENGVITNTLIPAISVSVGDYVWYDANKDGLQDESDVPLAGVVLTIENADGSTVKDIEGLPVGPQVTDGNGYYSFDKLPANATYVVRIDQAASAEVLKDYTPTIDETGGDNAIDSSTWSATSRHLVEDEERDPTLDFGFVRKKVSVGDYVWIDENRDGLQDKTDVPLEGVVLTIVDKDGKPVTDVFDNPVGPQVTDKDGYYSFDNLPIDNTYTVRIDREAFKALYPELTPTNEGAGATDIDSSTWEATSVEMVEDGQRDPTLDFGFVKPEVTPPSVSVGDYVWIDENRDGLQDKTDVPLEGVVLTIVDNDGKPVTDVFGKPVGPQVTDKDGYYSFDNLPIDNTYTVRIDREAFEALYPELTPTIEGAGSADNDSSTWETTSVEMVEDGQRDPTLDFGFVLPNPVLITISGEKLWEDNNNEGNTRPESITINLLLDNEVIDTQEVIADADGNWLYHFQDLSELAEGTSYSVQEVEVKGYKATYGEDGTITNKLTPTDPKKPTGTTSPKNPTLPSTGDTSWAWYGLMVLALGSTVIYTGRRRKEKE